jgi:hypothetical protein
MSQQSVADPEAFFRGNYIRVLDSYTKSTLVTPVGNRLKGTA